MTGRQSDLVLAYHREHPEEVERFLEENDRPPGYWQKLYLGLGIEV